MNAPDPVQTDPAQTGPSPEPKPQAEPEPGTLRVVAANPSDAERGLARLDPSVLEALAIPAGTVIEVRSADALPRHDDGNAPGVALARALPAQRPERDPTTIRLDATARRNAGLRLGASVVLTPVSCPPADSVSLHLASPLKHLPGQAGLTRLLAGHPVRLGSIVRLPGRAGTRVEAIVQDLIAEGTRGPALITADTRLSLTAPRGPQDTVPASISRAPRGMAGTARKPQPSRPVAAEPEERITYEDIGGLGPDLARVREMIEWPLKHPHLFDQLGIAAPKGVLLAGPPGCGKTLIARAVAHEVEAAFFQINGPEIVDRFYGASEAQLRELFEAARQQAPAILFIDEIDAIAPKRDSIGGDKQVERRIVAQLLTLMDGVDARGEVIVIAATNMPDSLDPALRRPGRFDRELMLGVPDAQGRAEILEIHCRRMPLADDVTLAEIARRAHGYVGADLAALAREAGMAALRRTLERGELGAGEGNADVRAADFEQALRDVRPSALREVLAERPTTRWEDVGGLDSVRQTLIEAVSWPLQHADAYQALGLRPPRGILLHGPPGTGKTLLARALAAESEANFIAINAAEILGHYLGESERQLRTLFAKARLAAPCILFFDEIDALVPPRGSGSEATVERVVGQFLTELDGILALSGVFVLAATNRPDRVDPALLRPGRFDEVVAVGLPDLAARQAILTVHLGDRPGADTLDLLALAEASDGLSGAGLESVVQRASLAALRRGLSQGQAPRLTQTDLVAALIQMRETRS